MNTHDIPRRSRRSRFLWATLTVTLTIVTFAGFALMGARTIQGDLHERVSTAPTGASGLAYAEPLASANPADLPSGRRLVVAFVAGASGTIASDLLAPYDVFASSPAFTTYIVAAHAAPAPLEGGPAVVPTFTFTDVDADPALRPDLVVVPGLSDPTGSTEAPLRDWVSRRHDEGARVLGVCSGAMVLATTGMLDGLDATSHWSRIKALANSRPAVHWLRGRVYVEDGSVTTTAAVTSGARAALHLVAELAGPDEARRVAHLHPELRWSPTVGTEIPALHFSASDWPVGLDFLEPWFRPTVGVVLSDGVGELDATAAFEVYSQSAAARTVAISTQNSVRTRHGLVLLTTSTQHAPGLSRLVVPGEDGQLDPRLRTWAAARHLELEPLDAGGGGFTAALQDLADHTDAATASATAKMIGYPTTDLDLPSDHRNWRPGLLALIGLLLAAGIGRSPAAWARRRRRRLASHDAAGGTTDEQPRQGAPSTDGAPALPVS